MGSQPTGGLVVCSGLGIWCGRAVGNIVLYV
jgi:hypothetical protein